MLKKVKLNYNNLKEVYMKKFLILMLFLFVMALPLFIQADVIIDDSGPPVIQIVELGSLDIKIDQQIEKETINLNQDVLSFKLFTDGMKDDNILTIGIKSENKDLYEVVYQGIYFNDNRIGIYNVDEKLVLYHLRC